MSTSADHPLLVVDWIGASWLDLEPRLRAGQLPSFSRLLAAGKACHFPGRRSEAWSPAAFAAPLRAAGLSPAPLDASAQPASCVQPGEIDPRVLGFFPDASAHAAALGDALARLYSDQNAAVSRLSAGDAAPRLLVVRFDLLARVREIYSLSALLPEARLAAFRLLDLLLGDLRHHAGSRASLVFRALGDAAEPALFLTKPAPPLAASTPSPSTEHVLPGIFAALLGLAPASLRAGEDPASPPDAIWLQPEIPPSIRLGISAAPADPARLHWRSGRAGDAPRLAARFPRAAWPADAAEFLVFADTTETHLLGAASLTPGGGLAFALAEDGATVAPRLIDEILAHARRSGIGRLSTLGEIAPEDPRRFALEAAGFHVASTLTLWSLPVEGMLRRARRIPPESLAAWNLRPATRADVEDWLGRPETRALLAPTVAFDPDLSWAAARDGRPAGLVLIKRLERVASINLLVTDAALRDAGGAILPLMARGPAALHLAGISEVIFTTDHARREAIAYARRCGGRALRKNVRLSFPGPS